MAEGGDAEGAGEASPLKRERPEADAESWQAAERACGALGTLMDLHPEDAEELGEMFDRIREMYP